MSDYSNRECVHGTYLGTVYRCKQCKEDAERLRSDTEIQGAISNAIEKTYTTELEQKLREATAEIEQLKKVAAASEKLRYLMHIKGFEGTEECGAHMDLLDAMHDAGLPCAAKGRDRETTKASDAIRQTACPKCSQRGYIECEHISPTDLSEKLDAVDGSQ